MISEFNLVSSLPGVESFEGITGLQKIYDDTIKTGKDVQLLRSIYDNDNPQLAKIVEKHIKLRVANKIHSQILTASHLATKEYPTKDMSEQDEKNLVSRRVLPRAQFSLPAQVIIYGNKVQ